MQQRKFIFLEAMDSFHEIHPKQLKGHIQLDEGKGKTTVKVYIEGLNSEEFGIDVILDGQKIKNTGRFVGQNNVTYEFTVDESLSQIKAITIYPIRDRRTIVLAGYLVDKSAINIKEIAMYERRNQETIGKEFGPKDREGRQREEELFHSNPGTTDGHRETDEGEIGEENEGDTKEVEAKADEPFKDDVFDHEQIPEENVEKSQDEDKPGVASPVSEDKEASDAEENKNGLFNNTIFYLWDNLDQLDEVLEKAEPFKQPIKNHKWWYVRETDTDIQYYCILYNGYLMPMIYPFMNYKNIAANKRDWAFGLVSENQNNVEKLRYFVYGIPGRFYMQEQPFRGSTGYLYWQSEDMVKGEDMGYWLLYVDVHTGKIVIPRRPVKPPLNKKIMHNNM